MLTRRVQVVPTSLLAVSLLFLAGSCSSRPITAVDDAAQDHQAPDGGLIPGDGRITRDNRPPDTTLNDKAKIIRACVLAAITQTVEGGAFSVSECIDWFAMRHGPLFAGFTGADHLTSLMLERLLSCTPDKSAGRKAASEFHGCFGGTWIAGNGCRVGGRCEDKRVIQHVEYEGLSFDCGTIGASCVNIQSARIWACCTLESCTGTEFMSNTCDGDRGQRCIAGMDDDGVLHRYDCAPEGSTCSPEHIFTPCVGVGAPCDYDQRPSCEGSIATYCANGKLAEFDCSKIPMRSACDPHGTESPCHEAGNECEPGFRGECNEGDLVFCFDGKREYFDCHELGFDYCSNSPALGPYPSCSIFGP